MKELLISRETLESYCTLSGYINFKYIEPNLLDIQYLKLKPLLGTEFYEQLIEQKTDGALTYENQEFLNGNDVSFFGIAPYLAWQSYKEYLASANFISTQSGIRKRRAETSDLADNSEMQTLINIAAERAEQFENDVTVYLVQNKDSFPLVDTCRFQQATNSIQSQVSAVKNIKYQNWIGRVWRNWE